MILRRFYEQQLAQMSYLIGCSATRAAIVVDPIRDPDVYIQAAAAAGLNITHVTETHIHADYVSGTRELVARTGAQMLLSAEGPPAWRYEFAEADGAKLLHDADIFDVGHVRLTVRHTPGHTPEHISFVVKALDTVNLSALLKSSPGLTVFAPNDTAFPQAKLDSLAADKAGLQKMLLHYVINAKIDSSKIKGTHGPWPSGAGDQIVLDGVGETFKADNANIVQADVMTSNGIIHVVDALMIAGSVPAKLPDPEPAAAATPEPATAAAAPPKAAKAPAKKKKK